MSMANRIFKHAEVKNDALRASAHPAGLIVQINMHLLRMAAPMQVGLAGGLLSAVEYANKFAPTVRSTAFFKLISVA